MKTILFQGDSITDCGRIRDEKKINVITKLRKKSLLGSGYPALVAKELDGKYNFYNKGVSGDRILDVYARIIRDVIKINPDYMSLLVGVNDVWHGFDWNNGTGIKRFEKVYNIFIEELKEELPNMKIMILEPFVLKGPATDNRPDQPDRFIQFDKAVKEHAEITRKIAEKYDLKFVPLQKVLDDAASKVSPTELLSDGVHPTEKGHELIKQEWLKAFNEIK